MSSLKKKSQEKLEEIFELNDDKSIAHQKLRGASKPGLWGKYLVLNSASKKESLKLINFSTLETRKKKKKKGAN